MNLNPFFSLVLWCNCLNMFSCWKNNVCKNFEDFLNIDSSDNCWYNPDISSTPEDIANNYGFTIQNHSVETDDGYLLTIFNIQKKLSHAKKQPILLHHGMISSSMVFMTSGNRSLAFYLARKGYDVWLANHRGNSYSSGHSHFSMSDPQYWNFSFHEIGTYDLPAVMEYITTETGNFTKIIYIGHSMGCTVSFIYSSLLKDHAEQHLKGIIALSPASSMKYFPSFYKRLLPIFNEFVQTALRDGINVIAPDPKTLYKSTLTFCKSQPRLCLNVLNTVFGEDSGEITPEDMMLVLAYHPARTSVKTLAHFVQLTLARTFQQYDYGSARNMEKYNNGGLPPEYPIGNIRIPVHLFTGLNDQLVTYQDVQWLFNELRTPEKSINIVPIDKKLKFNHLTIIIGKHIKFHLFKPLMRMIKKLESK